MGGNETSEHVKWIETSRGRCGRCACGIKVHADVTRDQERRVVVGADRDWGFGQWSKFALENRSSFSRRHATDLHAKDIGVSRNIRIRAHQ
ncbi:unannotated protein [freshwater metagenome]|uniref:Unannotated protein n=1 Tax=freshwater metagenome TaxID=449393 RepID=A0A6J7ITQ8_9ZZZZ